MYSDNLKDHLLSELRDRHVVINREVEIRPRRGQKPGEETDLHIVASTHIDQVELIVEVKGSWNKGVISDMEKQLADRYLIENACAHGLYLVGWFECHKKRKRRGTSTPAGLESALVKNATTLCRDGKTIKAMVINCDYERTIQTSKPRRALHGE